MEYQRKVSPQRIIGFSIALLFALTFWADPASAQDLTAKEKRAVKAVKQQIDRAAKAFQSKRYSSSASAIEKAMDELNESLADGARQELIDALKADFARLKKAHELLTAQGEKLPALTALPSAMGGGNNASAVSFKETVAPILIAKCGNCHVNQSRGDFSSNSYSALMNSLTIAVGKPDDSRLIEVIENGEMPKGGLKVEANELASLKAWIKAGAKFDGNDEAQNLRALTGAAAPPRRGRMAVNKPTGKETVSFGVDIAPILVNECGDCHVRRNPRGNFSMANFRTLLRGGDGGNPIIPGNSKDSPLIKRLRGDGAEQMPPDRKLSDEAIAKFSKWVDEGATFDGPGDQLDFVTVAATVKAARMSHEDLVAQREQQAAATWKLAMGDIKSNALSSDQFMVTGAAKDQRLEDVSKLCESLAEEVSSAMKLSDDEPLVKGNISIFVFSKRYDFGEFGRMVEKRDFPKELRAHWKFDTINAYSTLLMTRNQSAEDVTVDLTQQIAALHVASQAADVPRWFADGMGLWVAKRMHSREDSMKELDKNATAAMAEMERLDDFVQNRLPGDQTALVSYLFVKQLRASSSASFGKLMRDLKSGKTFQDAFVSVYRQTPAEMLQKLSRR